MQLGVTKLQAHGDSKLVCYQVLKRFGVKAHNLVRFHEQALDLVSKFDSFHTCHVTRTRNRRADALASAAVEQLLKVGDASMVSEVASLSREVEDDLAMWETPTAGLQVFVITFSEPELYAEKVWEEEHYTRNRLGLVDPLPEYRVITNYLVHDRVPEGYTKEQKRSLCHKVQQFTICNGELYKKGPDGVLRLCVYGERIPQLLVEFHDSVCGGHFDARVTARKLLRLGYWWPNLVKDVQAYCKICDECQRFAPFRKKVGEFFPIIPVGPFAKWGVHVIGPIHPVTTSGMKYILTATDYCTRWVEAEAVAAVNAAATAEFIYQNIVCRFGCPSEIVSDQGKEFVN